MTPRIYILFTVVVILVVFNVIEWWPNKNTYQEIAVVHSIPSVMDFQLAGQDLTTSEKLLVKRDLFQPVIKNIKKKVQEKVEPKQKAIIDPVQIKPSAVELARKSAELELNQFQLVGILFQGTLKKAFVKHGDENLTVKINDIIYGKYIVDNITATNIVLRNVKINFKKKIELIN